MRLHGGHDGYRYKAEHQLRSIPVSQAGWSRCQDKHAYLASRDISARFIVSVMRQSSKLRLPPDMSYGPLVVQASHPGELGAINQDKVGKRAQTLHSLLHGLHGRLQDVDAVDHCRLNHLAASTHQISMTDLNIPMAEAVWPWQFSAVQGRTGCMAKACRHQQCACDSHPVKHQTIDVTLGCGL